MYPLFIGISLPKNIQKELARICHGLPNVNWNQEEDLHIIVRHIGTVNDNILWNIEEVLNEMVFSPFSLSIKSVGFSSTKGSHGVLWAGIEQSDKLELFRKKIQTSLHSFPIESEIRGFKPHIPLGRSFNLSDERLASFLENNYLLSLSPFIAEQFSLFSVQTTNKIIFYKNELNFKLKG